MAPASPSLCCKAQPLHCSNITACGRELWARWKNLISVKMNLLKQGGEELKLDSSPKWGSSKRMGKSWRESKKKKKTLTVFAVEINIGGSVFWTSHCLVPQALALDWDLAPVSFSSPMQSPAFWKSVLNSCSKNCCAAAAELGKKLFLLPMQEH